MMATATTTISQQLSNMLTGIQNAASTANNAAQIAIQNFAANAVGTTDNPGFAYDILLWSLCVAGFAIGASAVFRLAGKYGREDRSITGGSIISRFIVGSCLIAFSNFKSIADQSLLGPNLNDDTSSLTAGLRPEYIATFDALAMIVVFFGWVAMAKSLFIFKGIGDGNTREGMGTGLTFLVCGVLMANFKLTLLLAKSLVT